MGLRHKRQKSAPQQIADGPASPFFAFFKNRITWETAAPAILFLFGAYLSILYFGHQAVPNSDFPAFVRTGRDILHFQLPYSFKRLPGLGILQIALSVFVRSPYPTLTAGLLLNALLYPFCGLLLFRIAGRFLGRGAFWITLLSLANPWVLSWLVHPIAEVPLLFFFLLTFYLLFEQGRWAYAAAFAASMIRYEGAILIGLVFLWDVPNHRTWRQWLIALGLAFLSGLPIALWILGQILTHEAGGANDYLSSYQAAAGGQAMVYGEFAEYVRQVSLGAYLEIPVLSRSAGAQNCLTWSSWGLLAAGLIAAAGRGLYQKRWDVLSLLVFAAIYFLLHASRTGTRSRYAVPMAWMILLICLYGIQELGQLVRRKICLPNSVITGLQVTLCLISIVLAVSLLEKVTDLQKISPPSKWIPWVGLCGGLLWGLLQMVRLKSQAGWTLAAFGLTAFALMSNQVSLIPTMGNGAIDREFKDLADWYLKNAAPGEKMVTTLPKILALFAPEKQNPFVLTGWIEGDSTEEFIRGCYKQNITYLAWDSRLGLAVQNAYYKMYKLERIEFLGPRAGPDNRMALPPKKNGPFELIGTIQNSHYPSRFILIYRLAPLPAVQDKSQ